MVNSSKTNNNYSIKVDYETYEKISNLNKETYIPMGKIIKLAIEEYIKNSKRKK